MDCSTPGFSVLHYVPEFAQTRVHWVIDTLIQPSYPLVPPFPFVVNSKIIIANIDVKGLTLYVFFQELYDFKSYIQVFNSFWLDTYDGVK